MPQTHYISWVPAPNTIKLIDKIHTFLFRSTFGIVGGRLDGLDILLLTTIGRKTGRARCVPLPYFRDGDRYLLVASFGGNAHNPAWFANLTENPAVRVQLGRRSWNTHAEVARGAERDRLWADITREFPRYAVYQTKTPRVIPVIVLNPA
jgi:F420H(2)-dependent quinone reductase